MVVTSSMEFRQKRFLASKPVDVISVKFHTIRIDLALLKLYRTTELKDADFHLKLAYRNRINEVKCCKFEGCAEFNSTVLREC